MVQMNPLLGLGVGLLSAAGPSTRPRGIGEGLQAGLLNMQNIAQQNRQGEMARVQSRLADIKIGEAEEEAERAKAWDAFWRQPVGQPGVMLAGGPQPKFPAVNTAQFNQLAPVMRVLGPEEGSKFLAQQMKTPDVPMNVREWQYYQTLSPEDQDRYLTMKRANPYIDLGGSKVLPAPAQPGEFQSEVPKTLPPEQTPAVKGARAEAAAAGQERGRSEGQKPEMARAAHAMLDELERQHEIVSADIDRAIGMAGTWTTGLLGSLSAQLPGTPAHNLENLLNTIRANIGFDKLQSMREASPTGGALGQVSEMEILLLQSVMGAVEQSQTKEQFVQNLTRLKEAIENRRSVRRDAFQRDFGDIAPLPEGRIPEGVTPEEWAVMTPEEKAVFQ